MKNNQFSALFSFRFNKIFIFMFFLLFHLNNVIAEELVKGTVVNATHDSAKVKNIPVYLQLFKSESMMPLVLDSVSTLNSGNFEFKLVQLDTSATYFAFVEYEGARYYSNSAHTTNQRIVVFDSTQSLANLSAIMHHLIIDDLGKVANIRETIIINNPGNKAVTGGLHNTHIGDAVMQLTLPPDYINFEPISPQYENSLSAHGNTILSDMVLLPGNNQVSYSYQIPWKNNRADINLVMDFPTRTLDLFIDNQELSIVSEQLQDLGLFSIRESQYRRFSGGELAAGKLVRLYVQRSAVPANNIPWLPVTLVVIVLLVGSVAGHFMNKKAAKTAKMTITPVKEDSLSKQKNDIIEQIARLDNEAQTPEHKAKRDKLFEKLQNIEIQLMARTDNTNDKKNK